MDKRFDNQVASHINFLAVKKSVETKAIRIYRTGLKQWQKSAMLRKQAAKHGEPDKWERIKKTMDMRQHVR